MTTMTQGSQVTPSEIDPQSGGSAFGLASRHVCPFCGTILELQDGPCPRCSLEDTPQTRQSTRSRLGPWYVLQTRNPYAPGMKYNTILALIRRGQVTPKSVIRGPTTGQFWRFAGRVKGISREFQLCWACGSSIVTSAVSCARCGKTQELPPNPDALLEGESAAKTLYVDVSPKSAITTPGGSLPEASPAPEMPGFEIPKTKPNVPSAGATMAINAGLPPPESAPPELRTRPLQQMREKILSAKELAAAFSLQYNPSAPAPAGTKPKSKARPMIAAGVLILLGCGAAMMNPTARQMVAGLLGMNVHTTPPPQAAASNNNSSDDPALDLEHFRPDWAMKPPVTPPVTPPVDSPVAPSAPQENPAQNQDTQSQTPAPAPQPQPQPQDDSNNAPANLPMVSTAQNSGEDLDSLAMRLRLSGLDAEARHDYAAAQYFYQQIEKLPKDHWPADTDQLLKNAQKMNQSAAGDQH
jgi:hypothetical protein